MYQSCYSKSIEKNLNMVPSRTNEQLGGNLLVAKADIQALKGAYRQPVAVQYGTGRVDGFSENHCKSVNSAVLFDIEIHCSYY